MAQRSAMASKAGMDRAQTARWPTARRLPQPVSRQRPGAGRSARIPGARRRAPHRLERDRPHADPVCARTPGRPRNRRLVCGRPVRLGGVWLGPNQQTPSGLQHRDGVVQDAVATRQPRGPDAVHRTRPRPQRGARPFGQTAFAAHRAPDAAGGPSTCACQHGADQRAGPMAGAGPVGAQAPLSGVCGVGLHQSSRLGKTSGPVGQTS